MKRGKKYVEAAKLYDKTQQYDVAEAVGIVKKTSTAKFDETVEAHIMQISRFVVPLYYHTEQERK